MAVSFWLEQLGPAPERPPLEANAEADVCVVGAGYTGLWTALELRRADPSLHVVVLEKETVGFGASGRNGGWVIGALAGPRDPALEAAIRETVDEIGRRIAEEGIDCDYVKGGTLTVAQTAVQLDRLHAQQGDDELLDAGELAARVRVRGALGALFSPDCARVQPAKLVRGVADAAERAGVTIHERTPALELAAGRVRTPSGEVHARWIVRATEAYTADLPGLRRELAPVTSAMIATEPLPAEAWAELGWDGCETMLDGRNLYTYLQRTADGRIALGGRGVPYVFGSGTAREFPPPGSVVEHLRGRVRDLFGVDAEVAAAWQGVLGVSRTWRPAVGVDRARGLAWAGGYAGDGVAAANLAARTLRDLILGRDSELTRLPWVGPLERRWEPEPFRYAGIHGVHRLLGAADCRELRTGKESLFARVAGTISGRGH
jgi:glycine/D-amino acid oxidase-like deaminating enzyme